MVTLHQVQSYYSVLSLLLRLQRTSAEFCTTAEVLSLLSSAGKGVDHTRRPDGHQQQFLSTTTIRLLHNSSPTTISSSPKVHRACVSTDHRPNRVNNLLYNDRGALCILESTTLKYGRHGHGVCASLCRNIGVKTESFSHTSTWDIDKSLNPQRDKLNTHAHDVQSS